MAMNATLIAHANRASAKRVREENSDLFSFCVVAQSGCNSVTFQRQPTEPDALHKQMIEEA
jgi:hypothetical protein